MRKNINVKSKYVAPKKGYFEIDNGNHIYRLMRGMTDAMNQDELANFSRKEKGKGNPYAIGLPKFIAICNDAIKSGNSDLMNYLYEKLNNVEDYYFLSRVIYNPFPLKDKTIHEYGMPDEYSLIGDVIGSMISIKNTNNKKALEYLTGIKGIKRLDNLSNLIAQMPMFVSRFNSKRDEKTERVVGLYIQGSEGQIGRKLGLELFWRGPLFKFPTFLVEHVK